MDLLAILLSNRNLNVYRALSEDDKMKLFSKKVPGGRLLCWSPCGKFVCVGGENGGQSEITIYDVEGHHVRRQAESEHLSALDWVSVAFTSSDFRTGAELMVPLLEIPSPSACLEEDKPVTFHENQEWGFLVLANATSLSIYAQGSFPLVKLDVQQQLVSAKLSKDLRTLTVLHEDEIVLYDTRYLAVRRQELRETATCLQRADSVITYAREAISEVQRYWNAPVRDWINRVRFCHRSYGEKGWESAHPSKDVHQDLLQWWFSNQAPSATVRKWLLTDWDYDKMEKGIMQAMEYANRVVSTRVFVAAQHLITYF